MNPALLALLGARAAGAAAWSTSWRAGLDQDNSALSSWSFADVPIGAASASRVVFVAVDYKVSVAAIASVTIGGVAATLGVEGATSYGMVRWAWATVPAGTTATIDISLAESSKGSIHVWTATAASSVVAESRQVVYAGAGSTSVMANAGGMVLAVARSRYANTFVWTAGATQVGTVALSSSADRAITASGDHTVSITYTDMQGSQLALLSISPA